MRHFEKEILRAEIRLKDAQERLAPLEKSFQSGTIGFSRYHEAKTEVARSREGVEGWKRKLAEQTIQLNAATEEFRRASPPLPGAKPIR